MGHGHEYGLLVFRMGHNGNIFSYVLGSHKRVTLSENDREMPGADHRFGHSHHHTTTGTECVCQVGLGYEPGSLDGVLCPTAAACVHLYARCPL